MKELGDILKGERLKQKLTLGDVSETTHISISMLRSLEEGNYELIGTPLLIRGFVKSYSTALGIDSAPLLEKYEQEILGYDRMEEAIQRYGVWSKSFHHKNRVGILVVLLATVVLVAVVSGGAWLYNKKVLQSVQQDLKTAAYPQQEFPPDLREAASGLKAQASGGAKDISNQVAAGARDLKSPAPATPDVSSQASLQDKSSAGSVAENTQLASTGEAQPNPMHRLEVDAARKCWVRVTIDGKNVHEETLEPGDKRTWDAREKIDVILGNAEGTSLKWDGQPVKMGASKGGVLRVKLPETKLTGSSQAPSP
jgi:cytoskeleton protein RodZ